MIIMYTGDKEGYSVKLGTCTIYCLRGHPYYVPPSVELQEDFIELKNNDEIQKYEIEPHERKPKYLFYIPSSEYQTIMFLPTLKYWRDHNLTAIIDVCCPFEYRDMLESFGVDIVTKEHVSKSNDYDRIFDFNKIKFTAIQKAVSHPVDLYFSVLEIDRKDAIEKGYIHPEIYCDIIKDSEDIIIGIDVSGGLPINTWDTTAMKTEVFTLLEIIEDKYKCKFVLFNNHPYNEEHLKSINATSQPEGKHLHSLIPMINTCDCIISFGKSLLTFYAGALRKNVICFTGHLKPELDIGCFEYIENFFEGKDFQSIEYDVVKNGIMETLKGWLGGGKRGKRKANNKDRLE